MFDLSLLNPQQREAAEFVDGYACVKAGAGSGKTRTLICRIANLIKNGIPAESILAMTFTRKAAEEMKNRASAMLDERCNAVTACTYHAFCAKVLRIYAHAAGLSPQFTILSAKDINDVLKQLRTKHKMTGRKYPKDAKTAALFSASVNRDMTLPALVKTGEFAGCTMEILPQLEKLYGLYQEYKRERMLLDYDDILVKMLSLLETNFKVREQISDTYRYILIDEYQDTNVIQERIGLLLAKKHGNLMVVGDYGQSLYAFRGADVRNIIEFPNKVPNCKVITLYENYRSTEPIVVLGNAVIAQSTETTPLTMHAQVTGLKPSLCIVSGQTEEVETVHKCIQRMLAAGKQMKDIAILYRSSMSANLMETFLTKAEIPYQKFGGLKFFEREHIQVILAFLRITVNDNDEISWFRVLRLLEGVGDVYSQRIAELCLSQGKNALVMNKYVKNAFYKRLVELYKFLDSLDGNVSDVVSKVSLFYHELMNHNINIMKTDEETRRDKLEELRSHMEDIEVLIEAAKAYGSVNSFLDDFTLDNKQAAEGEQGSLTLSTIHSAKGLEWDSVFILDCIDTVFPSTTKEDIGTKTDNEELRCLYVAVTRAKNNLFLFAPQRKKTYSGLYETAEVSHFLTGISGTYETRYINTTSNPE